MNTNTNADLRDNRRFPRVSVDFVTVEVYSTVGEAQDPEMCFVINVSEGGMMFRAEKDYESGQRVQVTFSVSNSANRDGDAMIRTDARVIHVRPTENSRFYGIQFTGLGSAERVALREYVQSRLSTGSATPSI
jgi:c-di-GMP-binding flagellar brake protein YcgR